jgi:polyhydroxybutyrate depolymerase
MRKLWRRSTRHRRVAVALAAALTAAVAIALSGCGPSLSQALASSPPAATTPGTATPGTAIPGTAIPATTPGTPTPATTTPATTPISVGSSTHTITIAGMTRTYIVYRPAVLPAAAPLVVMLHGGFGSASQAEKSYQWNSEADAGHFLVAYPDGLNRAWNTGGGCCGIPARTGVDDTGFITAMVSAIEHSAGVDASRVYAAGISNGGIMAYTLACDTDVFAAIGPDSATELAPCRDPAPVSVIAIHGTADKNIPYNGGEGDGIAEIDGPSVPAVNAAWRQADDCGQPAVTTAGTVTTSAASCPGGRAVELVTIAGAGHQWPGAAPDPVAQRLLGTDPPSTALDATAVIWQFFAAHPR